MRTAAIAAAALAVGAGAIWWWSTSTSGAADATARPGDAATGRPLTSGVRTDSAPRADRPGAEGPTPARAGDAVVGESTSAAEPAVPGEIRPVPRSEVSDLRGMLELPDGTFVPTLNGVENAPALAGSWHRPIPWSPIRRMEIAPGGVEWYVHADGSRSTTVMALNPQRGEWTAVTRVGHPTAAPGSRGSGPKPPAGAAPARPPGSGSDGE